MPTTSSKRLELYRRSVIVTGGHYSISTLLGSMLTLSPRLCTVFEPLNPKKFCSDRTLNVEHEYKYYDESRYAELRDGLMELMFADRMAAELLIRFRRIRDWEGASSWVFGAARDARKKAQPRPAVFKAPFAVFSARTMQQMDGLRVVLGVRHPCAWIESILRRDGGYDIANFDQPAIIEAMPDFADRIARYTREPPPPLEQAILAWQILASFQQRFLLPDRRTLLVRQDDLAIDPAGQARRLYEFVDIDPPASLPGFLDKTFLLEDRGNTDGDRSYIRRDARTVLGKWRERLSPEAQVRIRLAAGDLATGFGYQADDWKR
jgi:hypothetical protein